MKFIKKLLYGILGLLSMISLFIILCAFQPQLADEVSGFLYRNLGNKGAGHEDGSQGILPDMAEGNREGGNGEKENGEEGSREEENEREENEDLESSPVPDYVPPERSEIAMPKEVAGKSGYLPVQENTEEIDDEEAEELRKYYTYGETGEDLDFDTEYYPYYGMLSEKEQALYRQIYANAMALNGIFNPIEPVSQRELRNIFIAVFNDHPDLFWLDSAYQGKFSRNGGCAEISLQFNYLVDDLEGAKNEFQSAADEILAGARGLESDYEKEVYVHNALLDRIEYDLQAPLNQSAYSAMVNGRTVCAGYARSFQYLMTQMGVPCYYCTGYAGENHAWNIIRLDGEFYNVDATWDDTTPNTYDYFNKTDNEFAPNHRREELSVYLPSCGGTKYSNLETARTEEVDDRRGLEEAGFSEDDVLYNMEDYYEDCYRQILEQNGSAQFENIVDSEELWLRCYRAYKDDSYSAGYMDKVLEELQAAGCEVDIEAESLRDGRVLLQHSIRFF